MVGAIGGIFGVLVALVANQPPTLNPGDQFRITTPQGQPNYTTTVAEPPAHDQPPVSDTPVASGPAKPPPPTIP